MLTRTARTERSRPKLSLFGIGFGLSGLAGTWTAAYHAGLATPWVAHVLWAVAAGAWLVLAVRHVRGASLGQLREELRDPVLGPFAALIPVTGLLLGGRLLGLQRDAGQAAVVVLTVVAGLFGTWFFARLLGGGLDVDRLHAGYLLPTTAAPLIASQALAAAGFVVAGRAAFAVGILSWLTLGPVLLARFAFRPHLPASLVPSFAIFSAPPAVAGNAWFSLHGLEIDPAQQAFLGFFVFLLGVQFFLVPTYLRLDFALSWWALTFTTAASGTYVVQLCRAAAYPGWQLVAWLAVGLASAVIAAIVLGSAKLVIVSWLPHNKS